MPVSRCVCFRVSFEELLEKAHELDISDVGELRKHIPFGMSCRYCVPYVDEALKTGRTRLPVKKS